MFLYGNMTDAPETESEVDLGQLLQRVSSGDEAAFRRLHDATRARLFGVIYKTVRDLGSNKFFAAAGVLVALAGKAG